MPLILRLNVRDLPALRRLVCTLPGLCLMSRRFRLMRHRVLSCILPALAACLAAACEDADRSLPAAPSVEPPAEVAVVLEGLRIEGPSQLDVGQTVRYRAVLQYSDGSRPAAPSVDWESSNEHVAVARSGGLVTGLAPGAFDLTAWYLDRSDRVPQLLVRRAALPWSASGRGPAVVDIDPRVERFRLQAHYRGRSSRQFIVWCGSPERRGGKLVDMRLGRGHSAAGVTSYEAEHSGRRFYATSAEPCEQIDVAYGSDVQWSMAEVWPRGTL